MKRFWEIARLAFVMMPRTPQELADIRRLAADERVMCQLCHIARCDEDEIKAKLASLNNQEGYGVLWDAHGLRAYFLANGEWPK